MEWTNYNHLFYFWTVARHGSVSKASAELRVAQPTVSEQIRKLEEALGVRLFERAGRGIRLTDSGQTIFSYADQIFRLGREMREIVSGRKPATVTRLVVGVAPALPKIVAFQLLSPALKVPGQLRLVCVEDRTELLLGRLALHQLDLVLADTPLPPTIKVRAFNHRLGTSGVTFLAARRLRCRKPFPQCLDGVPFLMPEPNTTLHNSLRNWFDRNKVRPTIVGEFSDSALLKIFGQEGVGVFAVPTIVEQDVVTRYKVSVVGRTTGIQEEFYAITTDRRITHPAVMAITKAAAR